MILGFSSSVWAQNTVQGIVFDIETKQRVGKVLIKNIDTHIELYNNVRGDFEIKVNSGNRLVAYREGFKTDTITYTNQSVILFNLHRDAIYINTVNVVARKSPDEILKQERESFNKAYRLVDPGNIFSVGQSGAGLSISSIYNLFSREAKYARKLTEIIQKEYEQNVVDIRFSRDLVQNITGLEGDTLTRFMINYRPSYEFVLSSNHYELSRYVKNKYILFKLNPNLRHLPKLPDIKLDVDQ